VRDADRPALTENLSVLLIPRQLHRLRGLPFPLARDSSPSGFKFIQILELSLSIVASSKTGSNCWSQDM